VASSNRGQVASSVDGSHVVHRRGFAASSSRWLALCAAGVIGHSQARAEPCATPSPACHLQNGKELLTDDPRRAADELLASYQLDERTDTLALYAIALQLDHRYALALETWKRVIVFRDSELEAAKDTARTATGRKRAAARAALPRIQKQSEQAAEAIIKLWPHVGRARIRLAAGQQVMVTRDGAEIDVSKDVVVNAGGDELVFAYKGGGVERVAVQVAPGGLTQIDAPSEPAAKQPPKLVASRSREPAEPPPKLAVSQARDRAESPAPSPKPEPEARPQPASSPPAAKPLVKPEPSPEPESRIVEQRPGLALDGLRDEPRSPTMSRVGLGLVAGAVVVGGVAGGLGLLANRDYDRARAAGCDAGGRCPFGTAADLAHQSNDRARLAQVGAIGAGVLAATGVTLWIVGRSKTHHAVSELTLHVGPSSTAISGRF